MSEVSKGKENDESAGIAVTATATSTPVSLILGISHIFTQLNKLNVSVGTNLLIDRS